MPGQIVAGWRRSVRPGDTVVARQASREVAKRVKSVKDDKFYLIGDNNNDSQDSRHYGSVEIQDIIGSIMIKLPVAIAPPKLVKPYGAWFGRAAAAALVAMALVHLFRIDTLIPILDLVLPGDSSWAALATVGIILSEVFAVPFALRMKLSPLAHVISGALVVFAPLWWLHISIWAYGQGISTGHLGQFVETPSGGGLMALSLLWLGFNYVTLWLLGFNNLEFKKLLKK